MKWPIYPLSKLAIDLQPGFAQQPKGEDGGLPHLRTNNVSEDGTIDLSTIKKIAPTKEQKEKYSLQPFDILFNNTNSPSLVGKTALFTERGEFIFSNHMTRIRVRPNIVNPSYIAHYLYWTWKIGGFRHMVTQWVSQAAIKRNQLTRLNIPLPPHSEQLRIVDILDQANAVRKKRDEADAKAERILPALFYKIFGDPAKNPLGFRKENLGRLIKVKSGNFLPAKNMKAGGQYPVYGGNGINGYHSSYMFEKQMVVIGRVGAYCGAVHYAKPNSWVTDNALYVAEMRGDLHPRYLTEALRIANLNQYAGRAGQPLISGARISPVEILVPPPRIQDHFIESLQILV